MDFSVVLQICQIRSNLELYENDPLVQLVILKVIR